MSNDQSIAELDSLPISELRKKAGIYRVNLSRDMTKEDIINAIRAKQAEGKYAIEAQGDRPAPGFARISVHADPNPAASNRPVYVCVNGYAVLIPRSINVDVPIKIVEALNNARSKRLKENTAVPPNNPARFFFEEVVNYPFNIIAVTPGDDPRGEVERTKAAMHRPREAFHKKFGYWPTAEQLKDALRDGRLVIEDVR
jgi:hypothetical protein